MKVAILWKETLKENLFLIQSFLESFEEIDVKAVFSHTKTDTESLETCYYFEVDSITNDQIIVLMDYLEDENFIAVSII